MSRIRFVTFATLGVIGVAFGCGASGRRASKDGASPTDVAGDLTGAGGDSTGTGGLSTGGGGATGTGGFATGGGGATGTGGGGNGGFGGTATGGRVGSGGTGSGGAADSGGGSGGRVGSGGAGGVAGGVGTGGGAGSAGSAGGAGQGGIGGSVACGSMTCVQGVSYCDRGIIGGVFNPDARSPDPTCADLPQDCRDCTCLCALRSCQMSTGSVCFCSGTPPTSFQCGRP